MGGDHSTPPTTASWARTWAVIGWSQSDSQTFSPVSPVFVPPQKSTVTQSIICQLKDWEINVWLLDVMCQTLAQVFDITSQTNSTSGENKGESLANLCKNPSRLWVSFVLARELLISLRMLDKTSRTKFYLPHVWGVHSRGNFLRRHVFAFKWTNPSTHRNASFAADTITRPRNTRLA